MVLVDLGQCRGMPLAVILAEACVDERTAQNGQTVGSKALSTVVHRRSSVTGMLPAVCCIRQFILLTKIRSIKNEYEVIKHPLIFCER